MDLAAVINELTVSKRQIDAAKIMLDSGVMSLVDFEKKSELSKCNGEKIKCGK